MRGIRRKEKEIKSKDEMIYILKNSRYITIALCDNNIPYLVTLTHGYDSEKNIIYFHCAKDGKKIDILKNNNVVWGQALIDKGYVDGKCDHLYLTTHFLGNVNFIDDIFEKKHALVTMINQQEKIPDKVFDDQINDKSLKNVNIGRIKINFMSGKRADKITIS